MIQLSDDATFLWQRARERALTRGGNTPDANDVLMCVDAIANPLAAAIMAQAGIDLYVLQESFRKTAAMSIERLAKVESGDILSRAEFEAKSVGSAIIAAEHVALAAVSCGSTYLGVVLKQFGESNETVYRKIRHALHEIMQSQQNAGTFSVETKMAMRWNGLRTILRAPICGKDKLNYIAMAICETLSAHGAIMWECKSGTRPRACASYGYGSAELSENLMASVSMGSTSSHVRPGDSLLLFQRLVVDSLWIQVSQRPTTDPKLIKGYCVYLERVANQIAADAPTGLI